MKRFYFYLTLIVFFPAYGFITAQTALTFNPIIQKVSIDSSLKYLRQLTGNEEIFLGQKVRITSRHRAKAGNFLAAQFIQKKMEQFGLPTYRQDFLTDGQNIYSIQKGTKYPNQQVIICAHYDCMPSSDNAPGADDNGSGTIAVLEAARILSKYQTDFTIIYAFWDLEEQGLLGSNYYAKQASLNQDSIIAVLNLDMISFDSNDDFAAEINVRDYANSIQLAQIPMKINLVNSIGLNLKIVNPGTTSSDHYPFWVNNYSAICLIENRQDFNKFYHQATDDITKVNKGYFEKMIQLAIGTLSELVVPNTPANISDQIPITFFLSQNYPNPFNSSTRISYQIPSDGRVQLTVTDQLGKQVFNLVDEIQNRGTYYFQIDMEKLNLSSGVYFYSLKFDGTIQVKKMLFLK